MKKFFAFALCALMALSLFAGCGQQPSTPTTVKPAGKDPTTVTTTVGSNDPTTNAPTTNAPTTNATTAAPTDGNDPTISIDGANINLMGLYTVTDPEGVEYDKRTVLYMPILESDEHYADGCRELFCILYGKAGKGVYMFSVELFDTADNAAAYASKQKNGYAKDIAYIAESNADFFIAMEAFIPDLQTYITNMLASGMMELS